MLSDERIGVPSRGFSDRRVVSYPMIGWEYHQEVCPIREECFVRGGGNTI